MDSYKARRCCEDYQPGDPNYGAIQSWNAAKVYQQAIAIMGKRIDGN